MDKINLVMSAMSLAIDCHEGQVRKYVPVPYIMHPMGVANLYWNSVQYPTPEGVAACWLHDVVEDTHCTIERVHQICGFDVAMLVADLTNEPKVEGESRESKKRRDTERLWGVGPHAQTIKCCDIIHNAHTIAKYDPDFFLTWGAEKISFLEGLPFYIQLRRDALKLLSTYLYQIQTRTFR